MLDERPAQWSEEITEFYESQGRELWAVFYAHCNDADNAYDALQEAFVRLQSYQGEAIRDLKAWVLRVGKNWLHDVARKKQRADKHAVHVMDRYKQHREPSENIETREVFDSVRDGLDQLKEHEREILILKYALNWPSQRIAKVLEVAPSVVDMRLSRARKRLAKILNRTGIGQS